MLRLDVREVAVALEVDDGGLVGVIQLCLLLRLALLLRAEHRGHGWLLACSTRRRRRARRLPPAARRLRRRRGVDRVRPSPLGTALRRALPALTNGSSRVSRRRATRRRGEVGVVRRVRDGWARGAARSGPLAADSKLRALREALSAIPARAGRSRAPIGAARTGRSNRRKPVVGAAADNLQTRQPHQARIALQT